MADIKCFVIEPTGRVFHYRQSLGSSGVGCPLREGKYTHRACSKPSLNEPVPVGPRFCECGYEFSFSERRHSGGAHNEWKRLDTNELLPLEGPFPVGAMWNASWMIENWQEMKVDRPLHWKPGPDGLCLSVMTPGGEWMIDSRASNCGLPRDNEHYCWVRHGVPPEITVDKNGLTCSAGAGSIQCGQYHGFLRNGYLTEG